MRRPGTAETPLLGRSRGMKSATASRIKIDRRGYEQDIITNLDVRTSLQQREDSPESRYLSIKDTMEQHKTQKAAEDNLSVSVMDANKLIKSEFEKMNKIEKDVCVVLPLWQERLEE